MHHMQGYSCSAHVLASLTPWSMGTCLYMAVTYRLISAEERCRLAWPGAALGARRLATCGEPSQTSR
jgi:hypothetical protein